MKPDTLPSYAPISINCACGANYTTQSTRAAYNVDVCSACHPFFTGKARLVDAEGRVERFKNRYKRK